MKKTKSFDTSRRSVLKAVGASAVVGGVVPGVVAGQEYSGTIEWTGQGAEVDPNCESANYHFVLTPGGNALVEATMTYNGGSVTGVQRGGRSATLHFDVNESPQITTATVNYTGGSELSQFTLSDWECLDENGNGNDTPPVFIGCSQVCNVENQGDVNVVFSGDSQLGEECAPADPSVALDEGDRAGQENCWEIVSDDYKIIGAEGVENTNTCADVCYPDR